MIPPQHVHSFLCIPTLITTQRKLPAKADPDRAMDRDQSNMLPWNPCTEQGFTYTKLRVVIARHTVKVLYLPSSMQSCHVRKGHCVVLNRKYDGLCAGEHGLPFNITSSQHTHNHGRVCARTRSHQEAQSKTSRCVALSLRHMGTPYNTCTCNPPLMHLLFAVQPQQLWSTR